jgi:hypothetical protein
MFRHGLAPYVPLICQIDSHRAPPPIRRYRSSFIFGHLFERDEAGRRTGAVALFIRRVASSLERASGRSGAPLARFADWPLPGGLPLRERTGAALMRFGLAPGSPAALRPPNRQTDCAGTSSGHASGWLRVHPPLCDRRTARPIVPARRQATLGAQDRLGSEQDVRGQGPALFALHADLPERNAF